MLRKDDAQLKQIVDTTLIGLMRSGECAKIYSKWFQFPIPPKNLNLNMPMSPKLHELIKSLNSDGVM